MNRYQRRFAILFSSAMLFAGTVAAEEASPPFPPATEPTPAETKTSDAVGAEEAETATQGETTPGEMTEEGGPFPQVQLETIRFTLQGFDRYEAVRQIQQQMYSIPGVQNFIPYLVTSGLITYDLRYSGQATLLFKALQDVFTPQYIVDIKELGEKAWEITMRRP